MTSAPPIPEIEPFQGAAPGFAPMRDSHGRAITDLRLAVTDRCNYRCVYCRSGEDGIAPSELPLREHARMVRLFVELGIEKVRFTGGEPLLRTDLEELIAEVARMRPAADPDARLDLALTTNGHLLAKRARALKAAGLSRVTVSLDAVEPEAFARMTRVPGGLERVLDGIHAAQDAGLGPVKVNCVLLRGYNDDQIEAFAEFARSEGVIMRFIEWMPLEEAGAAGRGWAQDAVVPVEELLERLGRVRRLVPLEANHASETALRFGFDDGVGEVGVIAPVSRPFCGACSRVRLTADGKLRTCLFSHFDHDLAGRMRRGADDAGLREWIRGVVDRKEARHHIGEPGFMKPSRSMVHIGG